MTPDLLKTKSIAEFCKAVREREEMSQRQFAEWMDVSQAMVSHVELGMHKRPTEYIRKFKKLLTKEEFHHVFLMCCATVLDELNAED